MAFRCNGINPYFGAALDFFLVLMYGCVHCSLSITLPASFDSHKVNVHDPFFQQAGAIQISCYGRIDIARYPEQCAAKSGCRIRSSVLDIQIENDALGSGDDGSYTGGFQLSYLQPDKRLTWLESAALATNLITGEGRTAVHYTFGQTVFTPNDEDTAELIEDDRPYAGWLYFGAGIASIVERSPDLRVLEGLELRLGVVGPSSLAESAQNEFHGLIGADDTRGWNNQLKDEPGVVLTWVRKWEHLGRFKNGMEYSWSPHVELALGNIYTYGSGGMMFRFGRNLRNDMGPPDISPGFPGSEYFRSGKGSKLVPVCWSSGAGCSAKPVSGRQHVQR